MKQTLTAKIRLYPTSKQSVMFDNVTREYQRVCNLVSQWYFNHLFSANQKKFQRDMYHQLREQSQLNSLMVQSTYRTVKARYETVDTQFKQHPYHFKDQNTNKWYSINRDVTWLTKPVHFSRPQADYVRNLNYSFVQNATKISLNVLGQRIKVPFNTKYIQTWFSLKAHLGTAKLVRLKDHWFLYIPVTINSKDWSKQTNCHIVGIDRGLRQIMTVYDEHNRTKFFNGRHIAYLRHKYAYLRSCLQHANTKSAKRHLKKLGQQENRWMSDVNHQLSKTLIDYYGANTLFVLEDLTNVTFERKWGSKKGTHDLHSWSFYDLQNKLTYKAHLNGDDVITVDAHYTSQRCPKCGHITKSARNHKMHEYKCPYCGFRTNDDRIGVMNLYELGKRYLNGNDYPKFEKLNVNG